MKVFVTKYALTAGIQEIEVKQSENYPEMVTNIANSYQTFHGEGRDWHRTWDSAAAHAEKMRVGKIASLKKSIHKLERLTWARP
jgi:hypothetical protein